MGFTVRLDVYGGLDSESVVSFAGVRTPAESLEVSLHRKRRFRAPVSFAQPKLGPPLPSLVTVEGDHPRDRAREALFNGHPHQALLLPHIDRSVGPPDDIFFTPGRRGGVSESGPNPFRRNSATPALEPRKPGSFSISRPQHTRSSRREHAGQPDSRSHADRERASSWGRWNTKSRRRRPGTSPSAARRSHRELLRYAFGAFLLVSSHSVAVPSNRDGSGALLRGTRSSPLRPTLPLW